MLHNPKSKRIRSIKGSLAACLLLPLLLMTSLISMLCVDIGHNVAVRSELQNAVDAAALAGARDWANSTSWAMVNPDALAVAAANMADGRAVSNQSTGTTVSVTGQPPTANVNGTCEVTAQMLIPNIFAKLINHGSDAINVTSTAYMGRALASPKGKLFPVAANILSFMNQNSPLPAGSPITIRISADNNPSNSHYTAFTQQAKQKLQVQVQAQYDTAPSPNQIQTQLQGPVANPALATQVQIQTQGTPSPGCGIQYQVQVQSQFDDSPSVLQMAQYQFQSQSSGTPSPATSVNQLIAFTSDGDPSLANYIQQNLKAGTNVSFPIIANGSSTGTAAIIGYATVKLSGVSLQQWYNGQLTDVQIQGTLSNPIVWSGISSGQAPTTPLPAAQQATINQNNPIKVSLSL